jgi:phosphatidylglycerol:prolipoprotein diacylglycerol transferase
VVAAGLLFAQFRRRKEQGEIASSSGVLIMMGVAIVFVLPLLEERLEGGEVLGLPIRGYGVMLMAAVVSGVLLAAHRAAKRGLDPDTIYSLAFAMFIAGIAGARLFFVVQYWDEFKQPTWLATIVNIVKFTEGGLVVYGSVLGGMAAFVFFCHRRKLDWLQLGDVIAPSLLLGLAIGRVGCLLNGCCYGGVCETGPAVQFPPPTAPFVEQLRSGQLIGIRLSPDGKTIQSVQPGSQAAEMGVTAGESVEWRVSVAEVEAAVKLKDEQRPVAQLTTGSVTTSWRLPELPAKSLPLVPAQLYSTLNATVLCLFVLALEKVRARKGLQIAATLTLYPITRFLLEIIRSDEPGRFGTALTISQWVSIALFIGICALWLRVMKTPALARA